MRLHCFYGFLALLATMAGPGQGQATAQETDDSALKILLDILRSGDADLIPAVVPMVKDLKGPNVTEALCRELPSLPPSAQVPLIGALADRGDPAALTAIKAILNSEDTHVQRAALAAIGVLGDASCVMLLSTTAASKDAAWQQIARESLYRLNGEQVDQAILEQIDTADPDVRIELVRAIRERHIQNASQALQQTVQSTNPRLRTESLRAFRAVGSPGNLPFLLNLLAMQPDRGLEDIIATVSRQQKDRQANAVLLKMKSIKDNNTKRALIRVLGKIGDPNSLETLYATLDDSDVELHGETIRALSQWPDAGPMDRLWKIAVAEKDLTLHALALQGVVRMVGRRDDLDPRQKIEKLRQAVSSARRAEEKRRVLSLLAEMPRPEALELARSCLGDPAIRAEAQLTIAKINELIGKNQTE